MMNGGFENKQRVITPAVILTSGILLSLVGCLTLEQMAPPVDPGFMVVASQRGVEATTLEVGRQVYLTDCARCHGVEPIGRYSVNRWRAILPRMARESKLDRERTAAVEAYVMIAHAVLEQNTETN